MSFPLWHYGMLNDEERNLKYFEALKLAKERNPRFERVLDIGSGADLLSFYANQVGFKEVYACEINADLHHLSKRIYAEIEARDGMITFLCKHSSKMTLADLDNQKIDVIITELFDSSFFSEKIVSTLCHAIKTFLKPGGIVIPQSADLTITPVFLPNRLNDTVIKCDTEPIGTYAGRDYNEEFEQFEAYHSFEMNEINSDPEFKMHDNESKILIDLSNNSILQEILDGRKVFDIDLKSVRDNFNGFMLTFTLNMLEDLKLVNDETRKESCWPQAFFPLPFNYKNPNKGARFELSAKGDYVTIQNCPTLPQNSIIPTKSVFLSNDTDCAKVISNMQQIDFKNIFICSFNVKLIYEIFQQDFISGNKVIRIFFYIGSMSDTFVQILVQLIENFFDPERAIFMETILDSYEEDDIDLLICDSAEKSGQFPYLFRLGIFRQMRYPACKLIPQLVDFKVCIQAFQSEDIARKVRIQTNKNNHDIILKTIANHLNLNSPNHIDCIDYNSNSIQKLSQVYKIPLELLFAQTNGTDISFNIDLEFHRTRPTGWLYWFESIYSYGKGGHVCAFVYSSGFKKQFITNGMAKVKVHMNSQYLVWFD